MSYPHRALMCFTKFLTSKRLVPEKNAKFYQVWIEAFSRHLGKDIEGYSSVSQEEIDEFLAVLEKTKEDWQVKQAKEAVRLFLYFLTQKGAGKPTTDNNQISLLLDELIQIIRLKHLSFATEKTYGGWVRRFLVFSKGCDGTEYDTARLEQFLSHLAIDRKVSKATQSQAFNALMS